MSSTYAPTLNICPSNAANRIGLSYRAEAARLPWHGEILDIHTHIRGIEPARLYLEVAELFGVTKVWSMTALDEVDKLRETFGDKIEFIAVPNYGRRLEPDTFSTQWLKDIEAFATRGSRMCKFWAAPRGRDFSPFLTLEHPIRREGMKLAQSLGMMFMVHVADPDTWFATHYRDVNRYGTKASHHEALERMLDDFGDVPTIAAHMGGHPEDLDHLQNLLDRHRNLYLDTSATKWMVRELSKKPAEFRSFCQRNPGRLLFGTDLVASPELFGFDHYASRFWALRTMMETDWQGESPIVDPDLPLVDPSQPADAAPMLRGAAIDPATLGWMYLDAAKRLLP
ncbi:MAG: amidohydrolase family protein [Phycisphaeraceae bacterium]|nr:amidohydrolase family protein [Phycisphaeraceae bacterium]